MKQKIKQICKFIAKVIRKIFLSIIVSAVLFAGYALIPFFGLTLDGGWNTKLFTLGFVLLEIIFLAGIWIKKFKEWCPVLAFPIILLSLVNIIYYECISTDLEATWHFHSAHNIPFSEFTITQSYQYDSGPLFGPSSARGVDILYNGMEFSVRNIDGTWVDNYEETLDFHEYNPKVMAELDGIMAKSNKKYRIFLHPFQNGFEYIYDIILYTEDEPLQKKEIDQLDTCISKMNNKEGEYVSWSDLTPVSYHLYTVRDKKLYKKLCGIGKDENSKEYRNAKEIMTKIFGYSLPYMDGTEEYDEKIFSAYGDTKSAKKTTIFLYSSSDEKRELDVYTTEDVSVN